MDPNTQVMEILGDKDGISAAANQIHYKSLKNCKKYEYIDEFGAKSYVEAVIGDRVTRDMKNTEELHKEVKENEGEWHLVSRKKALK